MPKPVPVGIKRFRQIMAAAVEDPRKLRQCVRATGVRKDGYRRRGEAAQVAARMSREANVVVRHGFELSVYQCQVCFLWHVGSRPKGSPQE